MSENDKITQDNSNVNDNSSGLGKSTTTSTGGRQFRGRTCQVCGDKALGYNFNAVTCESCKAFFRRNALVQKEFTCPFNGSCEITVVTRRFCQKCRLAKCFEIGMKKEYIMSETEKVEKRKKIEMNRAKRRSTVQNGNASGDDGASTSNGSRVKRIKQEFEYIQGDDESWSNVEDTVSSYTGETPKHLPDSVGLYSPAEYSSPATPSIYVSPQYTHDQNSSHHQIIPTNQVTTINLTPSELVERIISVPEQSSQVINQLMPTQQDAMRVTTAIIQSPTDALRLINHFISQPGDALTIISKVMNSALDALSVFFQFMSSPTDALQIVNKIMSSPNEVLQFIQQLMNSPQNATDIMEKFMNDPAEALKIVNRMLNNEEMPKESATATEEEKLRKKVEGDLIKSIISTNTIEAAPALECNPTQTFNPFNTFNTHLSYVAGTSSTSSSTQQQQQPSQHQQQSCSIEQLSASPNGFPQINTAIYHNQKPITSASNNISATIDTNSTNNNSNINDNNNTNNSSDMSPSSSFSINNSNNHNSNNNNNKYSDILEEISNKSIEQNSIESILCEAIKLEYDCFTLISQQQANGGGVGNATATTSRELNDSERAKLNELIVANKALYAPVDEDWANLISDNARLKSGSNQQNPQLLTVINLTAIAIRRLIKMSKKISAFKNMCQEDQVALLKGGCVEMMILRSVMQYDGDRGTWKIPHSQESSEMSNIKADVLKLAKGNVYQEHEKFIRTFEKKWRQDENIILIMCAITLFTQDRPHTIHSDVIKLEQKSYYYLLRRYLESVYPGCEAKSTFLKLMQKINELHKLNEEIVNVYLDVNPSQVEPLLREIFDLKVNIN